ncbi:MAG: hypothetical protein EP330_10235 [Deltaproteobacteria bacterium]|nr:MAG: hypothetical protein EP330_10235 [Deltaproteobacteria bacterium]
MPGCLHRDDVPCPFCRNSAAAVLLLGLTACAGPTGSEDSGPSALYGAVMVDDDNDGYDAGEDCDDGDASIYPGADDPMGDGIDQDCDGSDG